MTILLETIRDEKTQGKPLPPRLETDGEYRASRAPQSRGPRLSAAPSLHNSPPHRQNYSIKARSLGVSVYASLL